MNIRIFALILALVPGIAISAPRSTSARIGVGRGGGQAAARMPTMATLSTGINASQNISKPSIKNDTVEDTEKDKEDKPAVENPAPSTNCRDAYRECMDQFCLLDESEGYRCACSDSIDASKPVLQEIQKIQDEASKLYTEGVEMEKLGAKAKLVFKQDEKDGSDLFYNWLYGDGEQDLEADTGDLAEDEQIGDALFEMASGYCAAELDACGDRADMEETLYKRQIVADCKTFSAYLEDQKRLAKENLSIAEAAVREARLSMIDITNKYNRIECFNVLKACVQDQGGCGTNFENCLSKDILKRRATACESVYDNCMSVATEVRQDWDDEVDEILADAKKNATNYRRQNCISKMKVCLEDNCAISSSAMCLTDKNVALEICKPENVCELDDKTAVINTL